MKAEVDEAYKTGDTRGGIFEVVAHNMPVGLGSHITWDSRLDGKLAQAIMSTQALKGCRDWAWHGLRCFTGIEVARYDPLQQGQTGSSGVDRTSPVGSKAGMTNGQDLVVRGYIKPISTLRRPLESVDLETREPSFAAYERSDVAVVPAAGVIGEAMVAIVLAGCVSRKVRRRFPG